MKKITLGILAHVDSGKTTLSEALLYLSGSLQRQGRVDHRDSFLDNFALERDRGITIFSKQARFTYGETGFTLIDTPGHVDFSAETERALQVLDYAVLVISASDGVQSHTHTLWKLLQKYGVPCFVFINKTDLPGVDRSAVLAELKEKLSDNCIDFGNAGELCENLALCDDALFALSMELLGAHPDRAAVLADYISRLVGKALEEDADVDRLNCWTPALQPGGEYARLAVAPAFQNRGLAQQMVIHILGVLKQRGFKSVHILVNRENVKAVRSYAHIGFRVAGECFMYHQHFLCYEKPV